jgi:hypothetical protein
MPCGMSEGVECSFADLRMSALITIYETLGLSPYSWS